MSDNRRRHANTIAVGSLAKWIVIAFFAGAIGLSYVYLKHQLHAGGSQTVALAKELDRLTGENRAVAGQISKLSSTREMARLAKEGWIKMIPIPEERIVRVNQPARNEPSEIRPVANAGVSR